MMKKAIILSMVALAALLCSCKKVVDEDLPTIIWESNTSFSTKELAPGLDAKVTFNAPLKIQTLTITLGLGNFGLLANPYIIVSANKGTSGKDPVFDLVDDSSTAAFLKGLGISAGTSLRGKTVTTVDLDAILSSLIAGQPVDNNTNFSMDIKLTDQSGNTVSKTAKFHYTSAPSFTWDANPTFEIVDLNNAPVPTQIKLNAPGKVSELTITLESGAAPELVTFIKNRTTGSSSIIDLINDAKVVETFAQYFPSGSTLAGKTDAVFDFSFMFANRYDFSASTNVFTMRAVDGNGKESVVQVKFKK